MPKERLRERKREGKKRNKKEGREEGKDADPWNILQRVALVKLRSTLELSGSSKIWTPKSYPKRF